jgi:predicted nucleic acid-binding Zn ribbon protein
LKKQEEAKKIEQKTESKVVYIAASTNTCISCGREIPEGIFVCMECEQGLFRPKCVFCNTPLQNGQSVCMKCSDMFLRRKP